MMITEPMLFVNILSAIYMTESENSAVTGGLLMTLSIAAFMPKPRPRILFWDTLYYLFCISFFSISESKTVMKRIKDGKAAFTG